MNKSLLSINNYKYYLNNEDINAFSPKSLHTF